MPATLVRRLQADRRKRSIYRIILLSSKPATLARRLQAGPAQKMKIQVSLQVSLHAS
jgi:hypothetical protein